MIAVAAILATLIGAASGAWAYWTATIQATATATTRTVAVSQGGFNTIAETYRNHSFTSTAYTAAHTGNFTITNTGQTNGTVTFTVTAPGTLAPTLPIRVWPVASAANCTAATSVPGSAGSGTWASYTMSTPLTLNAGAAQMYCVRTTIVGRQTIAQTTGTASAAATLTVTLNNSDGWNGAVTASGTTTQATELIYPFAVADSANYVQTGLSNWFTIRRTTPATPSLNVDVSGNGGNGTQVIMWSTHADANQRWEIIHVGASDPSLVRIRPRHLSGLTTRLAHNASHGILINTLNTSSTNQLWEIQRISTTTFQIVAHTTGRCLTALDTSGDLQISTQECSTTAAVRERQVFTLTREPLTFTNGSNVTFAWDSNSGTNYQAQRWNGTTWVNVGTATSGTSLSFARGNWNLLPNIPPGTSQWRIVTSSGTNVVYDGITLTRNNGNTITATAGVG